MRHAPFPLALAVMALPLIALSALPLRAEEPVLPGGPAPQPPVLAPSPQTGAPQTAPAPMGRPLDAAGFEARVTGRTLIWAQGGAVFGTEEYLPGRRVRWAFSGDICQIGRWYEAGEQICFVYDTEPAPQCWTFWDDGGRLRARFAGDPPGAELSAVEESPGPLRCAGPDVGV